MHVETRFEAGVSRMASFVPASLVGLLCLAVTLTGCGSGGSGLALPSGNGQNQGQTTQTGRVTLAVNLSGLNLPAATRGGQGSWDNWFFEVQLSCLEGAGSSVYRQVPVDETGNATISVELRPGRWQLDSMAVKDGQTPVLTSTGIVPFTIVVGQDTPVAVTLVPAIGTATFTVNVDQGSNEVVPDSGRLVSADGMNLSARGTHQFTLDTRGLAADSWAATVMFRCYRTGDDPSTDYSPCGGVRLVPGQQFRTGGDDWEVYIDTMGSQYPDGTEVIWQQGIRVRPGLLVRFEIDFGYVLDPRHYSYDWQGQPSDFTQMNTDVFEIRRRSDGSYEGVIVDPAEYQIVW